MATKKKALEMRRSTAAQFFMDEEQVEQKSTSDRVVELINFSALHQSIKDHHKVNNLRQVQELIVYKEPDLLDNFLDEMLAFQNDRSSEVRKFVVGFIEEACKKDPDIFPKVLVNLRMMFRDEAVAVQKRVIQATTQLYKVALRWICQAKEVDDLMETSWEYIRSLKNEIVSLLDCDNDGQVIVCYFIRTHTIKFMEMLVILQTYPDGDSPKKTGNDFALDDVPLTLKLIKPRKLEEEAKRVFDALVVFHGTPHISSINLMTCMQALVLIAKHRSEFMSRVIQALESLHANLPPTLAKSQVSSVRKHLKLQLLILMKHPVAVDYHGQISTLLTDLGATPQEISKSMPKPDEIKKRTRLIEEGATAAPGSASAPPSVKRIKLEAEEEEEEKEEEETSPISKSATNTAIDITAEDLVPRLTTVNVTDIVLVSMLSLPEAMPAHFQASYTPIAVAGTETQIKHLARLISTQMTALGLGKGVEEMIAKAKIECLKGREYHRNSLESRPPPYGQSPPSPTSKWQPYATEAPPRTPSRSNSGRRRRCNPRVLQPDHRPSASLSPSHPSGSQGTRPGAQRGEPSVSPHSRSHRDVATWTSQDRVDPPGGISLLEALAAGQERARVGVALAHLYRPFQGRSVSAQHHGSGSAGVGDPGGGLRAVAAESCLKSCGRRESILAATGDGYLGGGGGDARRGTGGNHIDAVGGSSDLGGWHESIKPPAKVGAPPRPVHAIPPFLAHRMGFTPSAEEQTFIMERETGKVKKTSAADGLHALSDTGRGRRRSSPEPPESRGMTTTQEQQQKEQEAMQTEDAAQPKQTIKTLLGGTTADAKKKDAKNTILVPTGFEPKSRRLRQLNLSDITRPLSDEEMTQMLVSTVRRILDAGQALNASISPGFLQSGTGNPLERSSSNDSYVHCLTNLLVDILQKCESRDRDTLFSRFFLEIPSITSEALIILKQYCQNESTVANGLSILRSLVDYRPPGQIDYLQKLLELTVSQNQEVRLQAAKHAKQLHERGNFRPIIEDFALMYLRYLLELSPPQHLFHGCPVWTEDNTKICMQLYINLLPVNHKLIHDLAVVYVGAIAEIKRTILRGLEGPVKGMGMSSPELLLLVENCPKGAETLVTRIIHILTDKTPPSSELVARVRDLYHKRVSDVRFLIPVLNGLSKKEVIAALPKLIKLNPIVVKEVFNRLLGSHVESTANFTSPVSPAELLVALHNIDPSKCDVKTVIKATSLCFAEKHIYTQEVLAVVMQQLMEQSPLPTLLMRTVIQSLSLYPRLLGFVMNILQRLIIKQVWKQKKVWEGFIKCCQRTKPQSLQVLLQLPAEQLRNVFQVSPDLQQPLVQHVSGFTDHQRAHIPESILEVLNLSRPRADCDRDSSRESRDSREARDSRDYGGSRSERDSWRPSSNTKIRLSTSEDGSTASQELDV
ncbi:hypothetical protein HPB51_007141 [Rhipicephalus microplus]|uniref:Symplekin n=1 Tax=Rhipicephalus microplus TaxID=6941 RepID=A0A9J6DZ99_RHIMP|nr:hypothetical protein HPB51_007141 [Rhipicephalus microplus]